MTSYLSRLTILGLLLQLASPDAARAQSEHKYWIFLEGKPESSDVVVSDRARERRVRRGRAGMKGLDRSVSAVFVERLERAGISIVVRSRWLNAVSASLTDEELRYVKDLPFVRSVRAVAKTVRPVPPNGESGPTPKSNDFHFGPSRAQLALMNAVVPVENGINGAGIRLGFLDTPFNAFEHPAFASLRDENRLIEVRDFVGKPQSTFAHGMSVASVAVGYEPGSLIGPAHGAEVLAAITEYGPTETNSEEDFFVAGLEWLEAKGADVVNVSLGYTTFDDGQRSYVRDDLDGDTGVTTVAADLAASLGVVVVVSAGNQACSDPDGCWYYVGTPADGDSVITVGAVTPDSMRSPFSSFGPTADGRIKPDVAALGSRVYVAEPDGYGFAYGTSFSSPLVAAVACQLLQVNPLLSPMDVRDILRATASRADAPDNALGWGIVNAAAAVDVAAESVGEGDAGALSVTPYPNPATDQLFVHINADVATSALIEVFDLLGRPVLRGPQAAILPGGLSVRVPLPELASGVYVVVVTAGGRKSSKLFVVGR